MKASAIFDAACELPAAERESHIAREAAGDPAVVALVRAMLAADADPAPLTPTPGVRAGIERLLADSAEAVPERIGPYTVARLIGRGGMGEVFEARQRNPDRAVALKVVRGGGPAVMRRFRREVEFLARLTHPGIAQIYDAGVADLAGSASPYFAMELVRGEPVTDYARRRGLSIGERVELVAALCDTVQFAHQQGVIHRDLKPSNILVAEEPGGTGAPKILDFGIARVTDDQGPDRTFATEAGHAIGTPGFMAPEQVRGEAGGVDTRCDIYALGVIAYLLLAGRMPHDVASKSAFDAARITLEEEPVPLGAVRRECRGDLETVVSTAMRKDKARRYASAAEFGADLRRVLAKEPVSARPPTPGYLARRFAARHKTLVGAAVIVVALVVAAGVAIGVLYAREQQQRLLAQAAQRRAEREATTQRELAAFLVYDTFGEAAPSRRGTGLRVVDVLQDASASINTRFAGDKELRGRVRAVVANLLFSVGEPAKAEAALRSAVEELGTLAGTDGQHLADTMTLHGAVLASLKRYPEAESRLRDAVRLCEAGGFDGRGTKARATHQLGEVLQAGGRHDDAEALLKSFIAEVQPRSVEEWSPAVAARVSLAASYRARGRLHDCEPLLEEAVRLAELHLPRTDPGRISAMNGYAALLAGLGRHAEAAPVMLEVLRAAREVYPPEHPTIGNVSANAASILAAAGKHTDAKEHAARALAIMRRRYDDGDYNVERAAGLACRVFKTAGDTQAEAEHFRFFLRARLLAAGAGEGEGVAARFGEYAGVLASLPGATSASVEEALSAYIDECRTAIPLIMNAGGLEQSPHAARMLANLARAVRGQHSERPGLASRAAGLLDEARGALGASKRPEEDEALINAVAAELAAP
ncbi:MAG TPA: serine/threonine-protein kinase [Phycisphaerales bacterium]|nr:serine/threonine-protein kinase [Phycisphaerales bacterium]